MKICSHCGESNADDRNDCWKCGQPLTYCAEKKFCTSCHNTCITQNDICPICGGKLVSFLDTENQEKAEKQTSDAPLFIIAILLPVIGLIIGLIQLAKDKKNGASIIIFSIVAAAVYYVIFTLMQ